MWKKTLVSITVAAVVLGVAIQLVPYGSVDNPPVLDEPAWDSPQTRALAQRACFDCHSNEVRVPWYGHVAPFSWLVASHVDEARSKLNFSEASRPQEDADEAGEEVAEGEMPPLYYNALHPSAVLTRAEREALSAGLQATLGERAHHGEDDD